MLDNEGPQTVRVSANGEADRVEARRVVIGLCRICGKAGDGEIFNRWVKDTFTNHDLLRPGEIICAGCLFWFEQRSTEIQQRLGKEKPQKMQNYSHFVVGGEWEPVGKGDKRRMRALLLGQPFPELAAVAVSGQKHLAFRARRNQPGSAAGWVQFEEQAVWVDPEELAWLLKMIETLYVTFSKSEIESGDYAGHRILAFGLDVWDKLESALRPVRGRAIFQLALFLAQRSENDGETGAARADGGAAGADLARRAGNLQEPLQDDDLGSVHQRDRIGGVHQQSAEVSQLPLWET